MLSIPLGTLPDNINISSFFIVAVIGVVETVRRLTAAGSETVPRDSYKLVQTPQVFEVDLLRRAYRQPYTDAFTDDASVVEATGVSITLVEGEDSNIKLTTPEDMEWAEWFLQRD